MKLIDPALPGEPGTQADGRPLDPGPAKQCPTACPRLTEQPAGPLSQVRPDTQGLFKFPEHVVHPI